MGELDQAPEPFPGAVVRIDEGERWRDVISKIESSEGWWYAGRSFVGAWAPDGAVGSLTSGSFLWRPQACIRWRFVSGSIGADFNALVAAVGAEFVEFSVSLPVGETHGFSAQSERSYQQTVSSAYANVTLPTTRTSVSAGTSFAGTCVFLPGFGARLSGDISVTSFEGSQFDRSVVSCPVAIDLPRGRWARLMVVSSADASVRAAFKGLGLTLAGGASQVSVYVRAE